MFDFFSSNFKKRAFEKALKEVEKEGFEIILSEEDYNATILPDNAKEVAELSENKKEENNKITESTLDISEFSTTENRKRPVTNHEVLSGEFTKQSKENLYDKLFADSDTFLSKTQFEKGELLNSEEDSSKIWEDTNLKVEQDDNIIVNQADDYKKRVDDFNKKIQQQVFSDLRVKQEDELVKQKKEELNKIEENNKALQDAQYRADLAEEQKRLAQAEAEKERMLRLEAEKKAAEASLLAVPKTKPKTKRAPAKRKRKYDADIVGGFNF